jgi:hypothetical protein
LHQEHLVSPPAKAVLLSRNNPQKTFLTSQEMPSLRECSGIFSKWAIEPIIDSSVPI